MLGVVVLGLAACAGDDAQRAPVARVEGGDATRGRQLLVDYGCTSCHTVPDIRGAHAVVGPPLTDWGDRWYIAGHLINEPDNLILWIQAPQSVEPGTVMPDMGVATEDARDMAAYLYTLSSGRTGVSPAVGHTLPEAVPGGAPPEPPPAEGTPSEGTPAATPDGTTPEATPDDDVEAETPDAQELITAGESIYDQNCARCHGDDGMGGAGYPALADHEYVTEADPEHVIETVIHGQGAMPAFGNELDDEEIAAVVSYIRNAWGNEAEPVSPGDVAEER